MSTRMSTWILFGYSLWNLMAKTIKPLTASQVERAQPQVKDYNLFDGDGLYLVVRPSGSKTWMLQFKDNFAK